MTGRPVGSWWIETLLRPVLIAGMVACLAAPCVAVLEWLWTGWDGTYFLVFAFLAALEGILSERILRRRHLALWEYLASRAAELLVLLLLLKLANYIPFGLDRLRADLPAWVADPYQFVNPVDLITGLLLVALWVGALMVSRTASELDLEESKAAAPEDKTSTAYYLWLTRPPRAHFYEESIDQLAELFVWGGIALLLASAALHLLTPGAAATWSAAVPTLLYFALGLGLLSQARFGAIQASWRAQEIPVQPGLAQRWLWWAVLFFGAVALVATLLPTDYTLGPVLALYSLIGVLLQALLLVVTGLGYLLALLLSFLIPEMEVPAEPPTALERLSMSEAAAGTTTPWLQALLSALFWLVILGIVGYALYRFVRDRLGLLAGGEGAEGSWWGRLMAWWRAMWQRWRGWQGAVQDRLARRRAEQEARRTGHEPPPARFLSLRRLPPRELIRYFYLSVARRAAQAGQPRRPGQTPYEYEASLTGQFPDLEPDLAGLTESFVYARYSRRPVLPEDAEAVKPLWQRIKAALRRWRA